jgi:hypothetical protein
MSIRDFETCPLSSTDFQAASTWLDAMNVKTRALGTTPYVLSTHVSPDVATQEILVANRITRFLSMRQIAIYIMHLLLLQPITP